MEQLDFTKKSPLQMLATKSQRKWSR